MPFTFSHPAIVLPLYKLPNSWVSMTGLVLGSMMPDFEYFIRMQVKSVYSHTWSGLFWFDLPLGLLVMFVYQTFVKDKLIDHLPIALNRRFSRFKGTYKNDYSLKYLVVVVLSILVGAISHILWDGFTHPNGYFVLLIPALSNVIQLGDHHIYIYKVIQHTSTIIGAITIIIVIFALPLGIRMQSRHIIGFWLQVILVTAITLLIRLKTGLSLHQYGDIIVTIIAGGLIGLITASIIESMKLKVT
jgi:hypothetical protein